MARKVVLTQYDFCPSALNVNMKKKEIQSMARI